jgi:hypothetical protein
MPKSVRQHKEDEVYDHENDRDDDDDDDRVHVNLRKYKR